MASKITKLSSSDFVHLHNHTQYSLLDGLTKIKPLISQVKSQGMTAVAMTDHGTLSGTIDFYKEAVANDIKPIIGMEAYVATRKHTDKDPTKDKNRYHLILLAMNKTGYQNLMRLSTIANMDGFYYFPRIDHDLLEKYNEGLIVLSGCMGSEVGSSIKNGSYDKAKEIASWYHSIFKDRYYLEIQDHGHPRNPLYNEEQEIVNNQIREIANELNIPLVVTCDAHYLNHEDQDAHEILLCVGTGAYLSDEKRMTLKNYPLHVEDPGEIINRWSVDCPEAIKNTSLIANRCEINIELGKILIPKFPVPDGETEKSLLDKLVYQGLVKLYTTTNVKDPSELTINQALKLLPSNVIERAKMELKVINSMGFNGYFLIIWDFIKWGKDRGIVFGPGRGSAAGSIIAYALNITELDPLEYDLLFERFLNPDRISMPDIDIDIQDTRRDEVIQYCVNKYGKDKVANIVTFGTMAARAAVRDVARVLEVPYSEADRIAKLIPPPIQGRHIPLEVSITKDKELKTEYHNNSTAKKVIDMAIRLEGTIRSHGVHAAGVVIAPDDIVKFVPLEMAQKGVVATQYPMGPIEELGLLKMDFLGLSNLTIIKNTLRIIKKVYGEEIDISKLTLDDEETYKLLGRGETTGVFQLESAGMKRYLKELKPTGFDDIIAMAALYRPGPLTAGLTDSYVKRKNKLEPISVPHPSMEDALGTTFGVLVYQEQVMKISKEVCGFSGGEADTLRKAIGKKNREVMDKMKVKFIEGGVNHSGVPRDIMEKFWQDLLGFADYAFNKSHSACYALIAYWTAYLKAHYPAAFMASLMTSDFDNIDRLSIEISECKHMNISVLSPDINQSFHEFAVVSDNSSNEINKIRFGLDAIKNVGHAAADEIIKVREEAGSFKDLSDFISRVNPRIINKRVWESLIKSGALDQFMERGVMLSNLDSILSFSTKKQKEMNTDQTGLFSNLVSEEIFDVKLPIDENLNNFSTNDYLHWERELMGLFLSKHPLDDFKVYLSEKTIPLEDVSRDNDKRRVTVGGLIMDSKIVSTKNNTQMAFIKLEDIKGDQRELVLFPDTLNDFKDLIGTQNIIKVEGKINSFNRDNTFAGEPKVIVSSIALIDSKLIEGYKPSGKSKKIIKKSQSGPYPNKTKKTKRKLYLKLEENTDNEVLLNIKNNIDSFPGDSDAVLVIGESKQIIKLPQKVNIDDSLISKLENLLGMQNVKVN